MFPLLQYNLEEALACAELCQLAYLSPATWGSKKPGKKLARTLADCPTPIKTALGFYKDKKGGSPSPWGVSPLDECNPGGPCFFNDKDSSFGTVIQHEPSGTSALLLEGKVDYYKKNERVVFLVFRGTDGGPEELIGVNAIAGMKMKQCPYGGINGKVHAGYADNFDTIRERVVKAMDTLFPKDGDSKYDRLIITGHSLGGGLCVAGGTCVACECPGVPLITMHSIAGAPFGDANFKIAFQDKKDKRMAKVTMFRTINDQDIIPQLGAAVRWGYCYDIAPKVVLTQKTLAWNPSQEVEDDGQGGRGELIEDHFLDGPGGYLALLYMYTVQARIQDDKVYNNLYYAYRCLRIPNTTWALRHQGSHYDSRWEGSESSTTQMCSYWLTSKCGFSDVDVALLFPEMRRLCVEASGSPGGSSFGHFLMACWNVKLTPHEAAKKDCRSRCQIRIMFERFDLDNSGFLHMTGSIGEWEDSLETGTKLPCEWDMWCDAVIRLRIDGCKMLPDSANKDTLRKIAENCGAANDNMISVEESCEIFMMAMKGAKGTANERSL